MLTKVQKQIKVAELRSNLAKYLDLSSTEPVVVSAGRSDGSRVLLDSELYNHLLEAYENQQDAKKLQALRSEGEGTVSWSQIKAANGL